MRRLYAVVVTCVVFLGCDNRQFAPSVSKAVRVSLCDCCCSCQQDSGAQDHGGQGGQGFICPRVGACTCGERNPALWYAGVPLSLLCCLSLLSVYAVCMLMLPYAEHGHVAPALAGTIQPLLGPALLERCGVCMASMPHASILGCNKPNLVTSLPPCRIFAVAAVSHALEHKITADKVDKGLSTRETEHALAGKGILHSGTQVSLSQLLRAHMCDLSVP
jgi:hypothetical protein